MNFRRCFFLLLILLVLPVHLFSQNQENTASLRQYRLQKDIHYGRDNQNTFDLYLPNNDGASFPLVVFFHGGSFTHGDKTKIKGQLSLASALLDKNIAFASVNYRYLKDNDSLGVRKCMQDAVRFLQYIRYHAGEYKIEKSLIGCYGESAGAGISLYLAFHDDMAVSDLENPVARESTRITCAGAIATQATYNLLRWKNIIPGYRFIFFIKNKTLKKKIANFYGFKSFKELRPYKQNILKELDMLDMVSPDDPPVWLCNLVTDKIKKGIPRNENQLFHHPAHAVAVAKKARKSGVANYLITNEKERAGEISLETFFEKYLNR